MATHLPLLYEKTGAVVRLRLNRPEVMNAVNKEMAKAFLAACEAVVSDKEVRAVVISGEGRAFMAGIDLAGIREDTERTVIEMFGYMHTAITLLQESRVPVVASLHGSVIGGGFTLALACDLAIAAESTRFNLGYANVGASVDLSGSWNLVRQVGLRRALEISLLCETFDAAAALRFGIVNRVVPDDDLQAETEKIVQRLANGPTVAYGHIKQLMRTSLDNDLAVQLKAEEASFLACARTSDFREALDAFVNRRHPKFVGS